MNYVMNDKGSKNARLTTGRIEILARRFLRGEPIPIFMWKADNYKIDKRIDEILTTRKNRSFKRKKDGCLMRGGGSR